MTQVRIDQFLRRYKIPAAEQGLKTGIDRLSEGFVRDYLPVALSQVGVADDELVCIRELSCRLSYRPHLSDEAIFRDWLEVLISHLDGLISQLSSPGFIRYPCLTEALINMGKRISVGDMQDVWAWHQLGVIGHPNVSSKEALNQWIDYLAIHPDHMLAVLPVMVKNLGLKTLVTNTRMDTQSLARLTEVALLHLGIKLNWGDLIIRNQANVHTAKFSARTLSEVQKKTLLALLSDGLPGQQILPEHGLWEQLTEAQQQSLVKAAFWLITSQNSYDGAAPKLSKLAIESGLTNLIIELQSLRRADIQSTPAKAPELALLHSSLQQPVQESEELIPQLASKFGGLVFLLNMFESAGVIKRLEKEAFATCPFGPLLAHLCGALLPQSRGDVVVDIVTGQVFEKPRDRQKLELSAEQHDVLTTLAKDLKGQIYRCLNEGEIGSEIACEKAFLQMVHRRASIELQPGWVKVLLQLDGVDTQVRKAGLDLNPGFVPWLGYVVMIHYE